MAMLFTAKTWLQRSKDTLSMLLFFPGCFKRKECEATPFSSNIPSDISDWAACSKRLQPNLLFADFDYSQVSTIVLKHNQYTV